MADQSDIVVTAFSRRYSAAFPKVHRTEGGFVNDKKDRGGATNHGVSLRFLVGEGKIDLDGDGLQDFDLDFDGDIDIEDIRRLSPMDAKVLFCRCFWNRLGCERWAAPIGEMMFDQAVNGGVVAARRLLQRAINAVLARFSGYQGRPALLKTDAELGAKTAAALDWLLKLPGAGMPAIVAAYRKVAADRYRAIVAADQSQQRFLDGWLRRADELGRA